MQKEFKYSLERESNTFTLVCFSSCGFPRTLDGGQQEGPPRQAGICGAPEEAAGVGVYLYKVKHLQQEETQCMFGGSCCAPASA